MPDREKQTCPVCNGARTYTNQFGDTVTCNECNGSGVVWR